MTIAMLNPNVAQIFPARNSTKLTELVLGVERDLVAQVAPIARRQSIALDLSLVERIDAAGVAALVELYRIADDAGYNFTILNANPHVTQVLALFGLDRLLASHNVVEAPECGLELERSAA